MIGCCFCSEINGGTAPDLAMRYGSGFGHRAVWATDEFVVFPTIGQIAVGHMLLVPRKHVNSLAAHGEPAAPAAEALLTRLEDEFGPHVAFEHGTPCGSRAAGCGIVHAHLHVLPAGEKEWCLPETPNAAPWREIGWRRWLASHPTGGIAADYLFVRLPSRRCFVSDERAAPSQFLRRWAATTLGYEPWDWREAGAEPALPVLARWMKQATPPAGFLVAAASPTD